MNRKKTRLQYQRKREGKTNYKKRLILLQSKKTRLIIRKTNKHILAQFVDYKPDGDIVIVGVSSKALEKLGWNYSTKNIPAAYLTGLLLGKKAQEKKIKEAILDLGLQTSIKGSKLYATLKGVKEAGISINASEEIMPNEDRLKGKHINDYYSKNPDHFSKYKKNKVDPKNISKDLEQIKIKILK
ncbi:MAG: 50S ribosomal protein L18 [Nanoarchaeota archaeon]|nr:50S ribosomal protein L18 [Nanoarchaeota archaeon]MBU1030526.1 50S ribosomal protein L18 [Nanoarchaeota archaeon]